jgi:tetratricopeptide (TPR) repeat protein
MPTTDSPQQQPTVDPEFRAQTAQILSEWERGNTSYGDALKQLNTLLEQARQQGNLMHQGRVENLLGIMHGYRADLNQSIVHFEQARRLHEQVGALAELATIDLNIGETYRLKGNFTRARSYFHRASQTARQLERKDTEANALNNEGQMWLSLKSYSKAQMILNEALVLCEAPWRDDEDETLYRSRMHVVCEANHALVAIALQESKYEEAWQHAKQAYEIAQAMQYPLRLGFANRALGDVLTVYSDVPDEDLRKDPDEYYRMALDYFREIKTEGEVGKTLYHHGRSLAKRGKARRAAKLYQQAMVIFTKLGMTDDAAKAAEAQLDIL